MKEERNLVLEEITAASSKEARRVIGLMSGTSLDGVDASLVEIMGSGEDIKVKEAASIFMPFDEHLRKKLFLLTEPEEITVGFLSESNFLLGELFAKASKEVAKKAGLRLSEIDLIGSHGQTVYHSPPSTFQIGDPCVIAERTGVLTVADFRMRDVAAGGQGAPLVPYVDYVLFRSDKVSRVLLNIGGIANLTVLRAKSPLESVVAFDTGPGNMVIDGVVSVLTSGERRMDTDGHMAQGGKMLDGVLRELLSNPFFSRKPPKSTGREMFGLKYAWEFVQRARSVAKETNTIVRTATALTSLSIARALGDFVLARGKIDEVVVSGGGVHNVSLMEMLGESLRPTRLRKLEDLGFSSDSKEALAFAVLANETVCGHCGNVPKATGAAHRVILGKIVPGGRK